MPDLTDAQLDHLQTVYEPHDGTMFSVRGKRSKIRISGDPLVLALIAEVRRSRPLIAVCATVDWAHDDFDDFADRIYAAIDVYRAAKESEGAYNADK